MRDVSAPAITEMRCFAAPPPQIPVVTQAFVYLAGKKTKKELEDSWNQFKANWQKYVEATYPLKVKDLSYKD